jgi:hypothetical protein
LVGARELPALPGGQVGQATFETSPGFLQRFLTFISVCRTSPEAMYWQKTSAERNFRPP